MRSEIPAELEPWVKAMARLQDKRRDTLSRRLDQERQQRDIARRLLFWSKIKHRCRMFSLRLSPLLSRISLLRDTLTDHVITGG
jgi:hypothetical protein